MLKATIGVVTDDSGWNRVRPPLVDLDGASRAQLKDALERYGFEMPGRREAA